MSSAECEFCDLVQHLKPTRRIYEDDFFLGILANSPTPLGHSIILPKRHVINLSELTPPEQSDFAQVWGLVEYALLELLAKPRAVNLKSGGFIEHFHLHIYPVDKNETWENIKGRFENKIAINHDQSSEDQLLLQLRQALNYDPQHPKTHF